MKCTIFKIWFFLGTITLLSASCNQHSKSEKQNADNDIKKEHYTAADSAVLTYWDKFDMTDTVKIKDPNMGEQKLADFIAALNTVSDTVADHAIANMLDGTKANKVGFDHFNKLYEHYLYDGNSPMRNDIRYESVLRYLIQKDRLSDMEKEAYRPIYKLVQRNKLGKKAEEFDFERSDGQIQKLSDVKGKYTLLLFYDTECAHCKETLDLLKDTPQLVQLFEQKQVQVLAIEPWGDRPKWKGYQSHLADNWINGFDRESTIQHERLYDLKASPTLYLLDENKNVLLKDTQLQELIQYLIRLT